MREGDEDWVKKCMEFRVEGRRPVGRPRRTWLESVEADTAELEIDKEDVHDRKKRRECYEEEVQPHRKMDYKPIIIIIIYSITLTHFIITVGSGENKTSFLQHLSENTVVLYMFAYVSSAICTAASFLSNAS